MTDIHSFRRLSRRRFVSMGLGTALAWGCRPSAGPATAPSDLTTLTLAEASQLVRNGTVSPVDLTRACLDRIDRLNPLLNAFITVARDQALSAARKCEERHAAGDWRGPLDGIPIALKDNIDTAGIRSTGASAVFENRVPTEDAEVARRLSEAGAILLGKLNLHEFAYGGSSTVSHFGTMRNPWNPDHVTGGSSGGPGAAVAADLCFAALGTDTAGSVRGPAAHCGIVGLKPTYGRVSTRGVMTLSWTLDHVGPLTKTVEDTAMVLGVIAGYDPLEPTTVERDVPDYGATLGSSTAHLRLGLPRSPFFENLDPEVEAAIGRAIDLVEGMTARTRDVTLPPTPTPATIWDAEASAWHEEWFEASPDLYQPSTRATLERAAAQSAPDYAEARREVDLLRRGIVEVFDDVDLLVLPTMKAPAEPIEGRGGPPRGNNNVAFDVFGLPAISIPCGFSRAGLPIGLQIVGAPFAEETVLQLAHAYEQSTGWYRRNPDM
jgi:aspartyl-tRNA(Asn)/glutamyl-tRNA(Gln) amidotransferase subunit A